MSAMGTKIDEFDVPVCNSFQDKVVNDQLCYEVDLNKLKNWNFNRQLKTGLNFLMDYNEDRQVTFNNNISREKDESLSSNVVESNQEHQAFIYLDTVGKHESY